MSDMKPKCGYGDDGVPMTFQDYIAVKQFKDRVVTLYGEVTEESAAIACMEIKALSEDNPKKAIELDIMSEGGDIMAGLAIIDVMNEVPNTVITVCKGFCASMGAVILSSGDVRLAQKHSTVLIHQGRQTHGNETETVIDMHANLKFMDMLNESILKILADNTGKTVDRVRADTDRDNAMDAYQAKEYGLVDQVIEYGQPIEMDGSDVAKRYESNSKRAPRKKGK
jgi:ATP-dependent Clp protease protease subunit